MQRGDGIIFVLAVAFEEELDEKIVVLLGINWH